MLQSRKQSRKLQCLRFKFRVNLRSGVLFFGGARKKSNARLTGQSAVSQGFIVRREKVRLIHLLHESSAASPESGLLSDWSKNKRVFDGTF